LNRVQQSSVGKRFASGTFWSVIGNGVGKGSMFVGMVIVARILGTQLYGEFGLIRSVTDVFIGLSSFGVGTTATAYIAELLENDKRRVGRIIGLCYWFTFITCLLAAVGLYFVAPLICNSSMLKAPHLIEELRISILMLVSMTFVGTQIGIMSGFQDFRGLAYANGIAGIFSIPIYFIGTYFGGLPGTVVAVGIAALTNVLVNSFFIYYNVSKYKIRYEFHNIWQESSVLWKVSLPIFLCAITTCIFTAIFRVMVAVSPNGFHELGIFAATMQVEAIFCYLPIIIGLVAIPILKEQKDKKDDRSYLRLIQFILFFNICIASVFAILMVFFSQWIMGLFGTNFADAWQVLSVLGVGLIFHAGAQTTYPICVSNNRMWECFVVTIFFVICQIALLYYFLECGYGALGAAWAFSISYIIFFSGTLIICIKR
jgi:O-antigen/teichoic acid export membrane protein